MKSILLREPSGNSEKSEPQMTFELTALRDLVGCSNSSNHCVLVTLWRARVNVGQITTDNIAHFYHINSVDKTKIASWLVSSYNFYSLSCHESQTHSFICDSSQREHKNRASEPSMKLLVYFIGTDNSFKQ